MTTTPPEKPTPNWTTIEVAFRAGLLSGRKIAKMYGVPLTTLQRQAKKRGWKRGDLAPRVRQAALDRLNQSEPNQPSEPQSEPLENGGMQGGQGEESRASSSDADPSRARGMTENAIIDAVARLQIDAIHSHKRDILAAQDLCKAILTGLADDEARIDEIEDEIGIECKGDRDYRRRARMLKAVSRGARAMTLKTLTAALADLVKLERQAFNMDAQGGDDAAVPLEERLRQYGTEAAIDASGGKVVALPV